MGGVGRSTSTRAVVLGGTTFDLLAHGLPRLPETDPRGDEFTERSLVHLETGPQPSVGGNGGNAALVLRRLGVATELHTPLGEDLFGSWLRERLVDEDVDLRALPCGASSVNVVATDVHGHRHSLFHPVTIAPDAARRALDDVAFGAETTLLVAGYPHPDPRTMAEWVSRARAAGGRTALDVGPAIAGLTERALGPVLADLDLLLANDDELTVLTGAADPETAARALVRRCDLTVVRKRGVRGAGAVSGTEVVDAPALPAGDGPTVGAGDAFNAGFLWAHAAGRDLDGALRAGVAAAALTIRSGRGVLGAPGPTEVERLAEKRPTKE